MAVIAARQSVHFPLPAHLVQAEPLLHTLAVESMATRQQAHFLLCLKVELADRAPGGLTRRVCTSHTQHPKMICFPCIQNHA